MESSIWWTTGATGDGATAYTQAQVILWLHKTFCGANNEGVNKVDNELEVTGTSSPVAVNTGEAYDRGFPYFNSASVDVAIPTPSANTRIDLIVLRADWTAQTVRITRVAGTEGAGAPSLTQTDGTIWDIPLAQASITTGGVITVTDTREFIHPNIAVNTDMLDDDAVTLAKMAANSVDSDQYVDGSIDRVHLVADIIDSTKIEDAAVDTEHLAADSVDDTKAGNRVPQLYRRQGGSATDWHTEGNTNRTPSAVRMQCGVKEFTGTEVTYGIVALTFPVGFSYPPVVFATACEPDGSPYGDINICTNQTGYSKDGVVLNWVSVSSTTYNIVLIHWLAIGPE